MSSLWLQVTLSSALSVLGPNSQELPPTLTPMSDVIVQEGSPAQFRTQLAGKPTPSVQWFREGQLIPQSPDFQVSLCPLLSMFLLTCSVQPEPVSAVTYLADVR